MNALATTVLLGAIHLCLLANAQQVNPNNLPPCPKPDYSKSTDLGAGGRTEKWSNCWGKYRIELSGDYKGDVLEGKWLDGWLHGQATYTHANGDKYVGQYKNGYRHGQGTLYFLEDNQWKGDKYVGEYRDGKWNGQGTYTHANGDKYVGEYRDGKYDGQGTYTYANGNKYVGQFKNGKYHGMGTDYYLADNQWKGDKYVGEFRDGKKVGQGVYTYANGDKYVGEFKDDHFHGKGIKTLANGTRFEGIWEKNNFIREAKVNLPNFDSNATTNSDLSDQMNVHATFDNGCGGTYSGTVLNGLANGQGTGTCSDGRKYVGEYKDGKMHGRGTYTFADGENYVGEFRDDKRNGQGINSFANGDRYVGEWKDSEYHGQGTFTFANGDKYVGEWRESKYHGRGIKTTADGRRFEGIWENNNFIREAKVNFPKLNNNVANNSDRTDIDRERQQLAEERRRLEEEKLRLQQDNQRDNVVVSADNRRRFALVIGNADYSSLPKLQNTINDARAMNQALRSSGFIVSTYENLDLAGMQNALRSFGDKLGKDDVSLVFFAGHGVQVKGKNYLVPVRENIKKSFEVPSNALDVDLIVATLENVKNDLNIVILDACRSPFPGEKRGGSAGLATLEAGKGMFVAFSTAPGKEASDGSGSNSPYTKHLARLITQKGLSLEKVFKEVRKAVLKETGNEQIPWENTAIVGDFYFKN